MNRNSLNKKGGLIILYTISQIAKVYKYPVKTLRTRVFKSKVGKIINGVRYLNEEEKEYLVNPSFHKIKPFFFAHALKDKY